MGLKIGVFGCDLVRQRYVCTDVGLINGRWMKSDGGRKMAVLKIRVGRGIVAFDGCLPSDGDGLMRGHVVGIGVAEVWIRVLWGMCASNEVVSGWGDGGGA